jgi:hypothetical protein
MKSIELGCWKAKDKDYSVYFGLFYSGRKPSARDVFEAVKPYIAFGAAERWDDANQIYEITEEMIKRDIRKSLNAKNL